ncbi:MAG: cycloeucalenol cycloisomerase [Hyphomicrobiaceae bacterium]|jgi:cycloeucalenol cycloisomerase
MKTTTHDDTGHWFSKNPSKAWAEKFFLAYLPIFFLINAVKQAAGWVDVGNVAHLAQNVGMLVPLYLYPSLFRDETSLGRAWYQTYWFKFNVWMFLFTFAGAYFFTEYFFDVLGMVYDFSYLTLYFDSALVGSGEHNVPWGMYCNAAAFFVVYHNAAIVLMRRARTTAWGRATLPTVAIVVGTAWVFAWAENQMIIGAVAEPSFYFRDLSVMLRHGAVIYACYFLVSFPMAYRIDENTDECWPLSRICIDALATSMMVFYLLDFYTSVIGTG